MKVKNIWSGSVSFKAPGKEMISLAPGEEYKWDDPKQYAPYAPAVTNLIKSGKLEGEDPNLKKDSEKKDQKDEKEAAAEAKAVAEKMEAEKKEKAEAEKRKKVEAAKKAKEEKRKEALKDDDGDVI